MERVMEKNGYHHLGRLLIAMLAGACILLKAETTIAQASEERVLKVAFPELEGISEID